MRFAFIAMQKQNHIPAPTISGPVAADGIPVAQPKRYATNKPPLNTTSQSHILLSSPNLLMNVMNAENVLFGSLSGMFHASTI